MVEKPSDLVQGTLDMLILKTLALEPMHSYGIAVRKVLLARRVGTTSETKEWGRQMAAIARILEAS